ncbi:MAG TPA: aminoglycoside phosphotransferase [Propionibacteriaceae bacterium]
MTTSPATVPSVEALLDPGGTTTEERGSAAARVAVMATTMSGRPVDPGPVVVSPLDYAFASPATGGLYRVRGRNREGQPWSLFVKLLQHPRHWLGLAAMPPEVATVFVTDFPWRDELELFTPEFAERLPAGLRAPRLSGLIDLGDDRLAVWMEDIPADPGPWSLDRFVRAARLLGRFAARGSLPHVLSRSPYPANFGLRMYTQGSVPARGLAPLADDDLWGRPRLAAESGLRADLQRYGDRIPELLAGLDALPQAMQHGDASPHNLLVPVDAPDEFVLIDISFTAPHSVGFDLGQLLVGLVHADVMAPDRLPEVAAAIVPAYAAGLAEEGSRATLDDVQRGFAASVLLRSGLDSMRYDLVDATEPAAVATFTHRVALTRFLIDLADNTFRRPS